MIKNIYFCITKFKKDNPDGKFFIILLGTDHLKGFFGLVQTAVGTDCNVDILQLGSCASGLTEVAVILALHPEWDHSPRRLTLQAVTKEMNEFTYKVDHINPASWRGNIHVKDVNLHTCWLISRQNAIELIPKAQGIFESAEVKDDVNFLSPFSKILINKWDDEDGSYDCSELKRNILQIMITKTPWILQDPIYLPFLHPNPVQPQKVILKMPSQQKVLADLSHWRC